MGEIKNSGVTWLSIDINFSDELTSVGNVLFF